MAIDYDKLMNLKLPEEIRQTLTQRTRCSMRSASDSAPIRWTKAVALRLREGSAGAADHGRRAGADRLHLEGPGARRRLAEAAPWRQQGFLITPAIPAEGEIVSRTRIAALIDKGKERGAGADRTDDLGRNVRQRSRP